MTVTKLQNLVVLISGTGSNLRSLVEYSKKHHPPVRFALVVCDSPNAMGLSFAKESGIPTVVVEKTKSQTREEFCKELLLAVSAANPHLVVLAGFMRVLSSDFITTFRDRIINIHPSLLPSFRGLKAQEQALRAGVRIAGCTVHLVDEEVDTGPVLAQAAVPVLPSDTVEELTARILAAEHKLLPAVVAAIAQGKIKILRQAGSRQIEVAADLISPNTLELSSILL